MKKTHWFRNTLIVLIVCGLVGTIMAVFLFNRDIGRTSASATILFSFNGAANGKAPNGYPFSMSGITSDEVINAALEASGLKEKYSATQLRENITVSGVYPEKIVERMTQYISLLDKKADSQAAVVDYHATEYGVTLYNDFDPSASSDIMTMLLGNILAAYRNYFAKTYGVSLGTNVLITDLSDYDYAQQLDAISVNMKQGSRYAREMAQLAPGFRFKGKGFGDIAAQYDSVKSDVDRLDASVTLNMISNDPERLKAQYESEIRTQQFKLESISEELKQIDEQVKAYDKDGIIYISTKDSLKQIGSDKSGTYDKLVEKHKEVTDKIAAVKARISLYQGRLADMTGTTIAEGENSSAVALTVAEKDALCESTEKKLEDLTAKESIVSNEFAAMLDAYTKQEINESTVYATAAKYYKPSIFSSAFVMKALKTAGPFCAVGFMVCLVLLIRSRRKEEKAKT